MKDIGFYLFQITAAGLICGMAKQFVGRSGGHRIVIELITGIVMVLVVLHPLTAITLPEGDNIAGEYMQDARIAAEQGKRLAREQLSQSIKERTCTYILDEAAALKADINVEVTLSEDEIPVPVAVEIKGEVSPYAKNVLKQLLTEELGIDKERQIWNCTL